MATNDIYLVRKKADNTFEELGDSPFQYTGDSSDSSTAGNEFSIKTKLRVPELLVEGTHTILDTDTQTSEQLLVTNDGTGPAVVINQKGQEAILDIQDDDASVLYIRGDNPHGGNVGIGMGRGPIVSAGNLTEGKTYTIASINDGAGGADTDFTVFGSPSNTIGEVFTVTAGAQGGTGTANLTILPEEQLQLTRNMLLANDTSIFFQDSSGDYGIGSLASDSSDDSGATISYSADNRLLISNPDTAGIEIKSVDSATWGTDIQFKVTPNAGITMGKVNRSYTNSTSHVEISGDEKVNLMLTDRSENIEGKLNINATTDTLDIGTTTAHSLTLGTRNTSFFTLDQYGHAFLQQNDPGSGLTGGNLTIDGQLTLGGDMLSIAGEEVLYSGYIKVTNTSKEYKILEFTYPTEIDDDNESTGDEGSAFIIEVWSDYQNAGEYVKYSLCHTFLDTANDGSTAGGDLDDPGSRDYALKILESHSVPNAGSFRIRLPKAGDSDISDSTVNIGAYDVAVLPVYLDLKNYAGVRVKITSLSSGTKRIATGVNWSNSDEYKFWNTPTGVTIAWNANTPNTEPGDALFADTFYGSRNVNWTGTESGYSPYYLKPADTGTSMTVAGKVGIGTDSPGSYDGEARELVVKGTDTGAGITIASESTSRGNLYFADGTNSGAGISDRFRGGITYDHNEDDLSFRTAGAERVWIDNTGNVGIGTSGPDTLLDLEGKDTGRQLKLGRSNTNTGSAWMGADSNGFHLGVGIYNDGGGITTNPNGFTVDTDGNVGIGTPNPQKTLQVFGDAAIDNIWLGGYQAGSAPVDGVGGNIFKYINCSPMNWGQSEDPDIVAAIGMGCKGGGMAQGQSGADDGTIEFLTTTNENNTDQWNSGGPMALTNATNTSHIKITAANHGLSTGNRVKIAGVQGNEAANGTFVITVEDSNNFYLDASVGDGDYTSGGEITLVSAAATRMTIKHNGNVGIGTDSPDAPLDVHGSGIHIHHDDHAELGFGNSVHGEWMRLQFDGGADRNLNFTRFVSTTEANSGAPYPAIGGWYDQLFLERSTGNVGIGTNTP